MPRAFVALDLPEAALDRLEDTPRGLTGARATPRENLHLTLAFLDDQPMDRLETLHEALDSLRPGRVEMTFDALDLWGDRKHGLLVATVAGTEPLSRLNAAVERAARGAGIDLPRRRFRPHVTLARFTAAPARLQPWLTARGPLRPFSATAECLTLYRSILHPDGALHEPMATYDLA